MEPVEEINEKEVINGLTSSEETETPAESTTTPTTTVPQPLNEFLQHVVTLYTGVNEAQSTKGGLKMSHCREITKARNDLINAFANPPIIFSSDLSVAIGVFRNVCEHYQDKGAFSIQGSVIIADALEAIENELKASMPPALEPVQPRPRVQRQQPGGKPHPRGEQNNLSPHPKGGSPKNYAKYNNKTGKK